MGEHPLVFQPLQIAGLVLRNRMVGLPIGLSGFIDGHGAPTERMIALYRRRAAGGAGLITVEIATVEPHTCPQVGLLRFDSDQRIPAFSLLVDAIHEAGAAAALQITDRWHTHCPYRLHELSLAALQAMVEQYARGAERALRAGFDAINVQGAHGWPLARFLSPLYNDRTDQYREPTRVPAMVVRRIRTVVGPQVPILFRLCLEEGAPGGLHPAQVRDTIAPQLEDAGVDVLDLTFGAGPIAQDVKAYLGTEPLYSPAGERASLYRWVRERLRVPLLGRSRITDPAVALEMVEDGAVDLLGIGRQLLADPDFPLKTAQRRWDAINRCIGCDVCLAQTVLRGRTLSCPINPVLGREIEQRPPPSRARVPRRVHIVGAGIGGLETAWGLARRGHQVTLWEQAPAPGGVLRQLAGLPAVHLRDLASYGEYVQRALAGLGVELRLGTRVTAERLGTEEGETVVLAVGAHPPTLDCTGPSQGPAVVGWTAYLAGQVTLGERVGVVSHGEGAEFALSLARTGHGVWLLEQGVAPHPAAYDYAGRRLQALTDYLAEAGVRVVGLVDVVQPTAGGVMLRYRNGHQEMLPIDTVLIAGRQASEVPVQDLVPPGWDVYLVGDCVAPLGIAEALQAARLIVTQLSQ
jgi:2,4-dienoyl-CoA reductase (NADPH2)